MIVLNYLLVLLGFTVLCALWVKFQLWLKHVDPEVDSFKPGCGPCKGGSCSSSPSQAEATIKLEHIVLAKQELGETHFGENECNERKSPS